MFHTRVWNIWRYTIVKMKPGCAKKPLFCYCRFRHITIHIPALGNVDKFIYSNANTRFVILNHMVFTPKCGTFDGRLWYKPWFSMVQMFTLRGINIGVRKSLGRYAKDFGEVRQRLWGGVPKTLGSQTLYHTAPYFVPSGIILCTMRRGAINGIAPQQKKDSTRKVKSFSVVDIYVLFLQSLSKNRLNQFATIVVGI